MSKDPLVIFTPSGKSGRFKMGTPVLTAAQRLGVDLDSVCGGRGKCSRCQVDPCFGEFSKHGVTVGDDAISEWNSVEQRYKEIKGMLDGRRLGCQALVQGDLVVNVPPESQIHKQVVRKSAIARDIEIDPATRLYYVEVAEPDMHDPAGDEERLCAALLDQWGLKVGPLDLLLLRRLQTILRKGKWAVTCAVRTAMGSVQASIIQIWPGLFNDPLYGIAVDLGSTTIAAHLCDLATGKVIGSAGVMNPQIRYGDDLMSRVSYAMMNSDGAQEMTEAVRGGVRDLMKQLCETAGIDLGYVLETVFVSNPVMHHLFLGVDPVELGQAPFALARSSAINALAREFDLPTHPLAGVYYLPSVASHVGADAAAVLLSEAPGQSDDLTLVVDVGTNAEIILGQNGHVLACSSPTGPAFEGAQVSSGQRAAPGAIERARIDPVTKEPRFQVVGCDIWSDELGFTEALGPAGVTGICGSGIIELVAEMRIAGVVDASGLIGAPDQIGSDRSEQAGRTYSYRVWGEPGSTDEITVTNKDIREIQMAKAALYASVRLLMDRFKVDSVDRIVLAGAFGAHISAHHAMTLGMIPNCVLKNVTSAGNAAGTGARIALLNVAARHEIETTVKAIEKVETAIEPRFQEHFVNASNIPNAVEQFPELNGHVTLPELDFNRGKRSCDGPAVRGKRSKTTLEAP